MGTLIGVLLPGWKMSRKLVCTGSEWEQVCGYSRAVRVGNVVEVAGTLAADDKSQVVGLGDVYIQTKFILEKISKSLEEAGASLKHVVRTRMYTTDISKYPDISRAHGEFFANIRPVCTLIEVSAFVRPEFLIEIEATAIVDE